MTGRHTTTRSRQLGAELKRVREQTSYSARDLARALGWSESKVSRMESGERGASEVAVATYLAYFRVVGPEMDRLLSMCRDIWAKDWLQPHSERVPDELRTLVVHETTATRIQEYEPLVLPGLLGGPFRLMEYENHGPVAYVENQTHSLFLEDPVDIRVYRSILFKLRAVTLDEGQSRALLASLANEFDIPEDRE